MGPTNLQNDKKEEIQLNNNICSHSESTKKITLIVLCRLDFETVIFNRFCSVWLFQLCFCIKKGNFSTKSAGLIFCLLNIISTCYNILWKIQLVIVKNLNLDMYISLMSMTGGLIGRKILMSDKEWMISAIFIYIKTQEIIRDNSPRLKH